LLTILCLLLQRLVCTRWNPTYLQVDPDRR
jgi:hypothetical protein